MLGKGGHIRKLLVISLLLRHCDAWTREDVIFRQRVTYRPKHIPQDTHGVGDPVHKRARKPPIKCSLHRVSSQTGPRTGTQSDSKAIFDWDNPMTSVTPQPENTLSISCCHGVHCSLLEGPT